MSLSKLYEYNVAAYYELQDYAQIRKRIIRLTILVMAVILLKVFSSEVVASDCVPDFLDKGAGLATDLPEKYSYILLLLSLIPGFLFWVPFLFFIGKSILNPQSRFVEIVHEHFAASIGIPLAALGSFFNVLVLRITTGSLEFTFAGLKFSGASGPITLWILCLLAFVLAIRLLWPLSDKQIIQTDKTEKDGVDADGHLRGQ